MPPYRASARKVACSELRGILSRAFREREAFAGSVVPRHRAAACKAALTAPDTIEVTSDVAGTCHVDLTFANGAASATDITMTAQTLACGSNPHACGNLVATPSAVTLTAPCADSAPSD
jgi:hypothetical protein